MCDGRGEGGIGSVWWAGGGARQCVVGGEGVGSVWWAGGG